MLRSDFMRVTIPAFQEILNTVTSLAGHSKITLLQTIQQIDGTFSIFIIHNIQTLLKN